MFFFIKNNFFIVSHLHYSTSKMIFVYFQVPDKARVTPASADPKSKFYELVKVS